MDTLRIILTYGTGVALCAAGFFLKQKALSEAGKRFIVK